MNAPKLVLHASLAGLYGALVIALIVMLANRDGAPEGAGSWLLTALPVVVVYTLAAGIAWPLLYGAVRFFASHPLRVPWLGLRYLMAFHVVNGAAVLASAWFTLSASRRVLGPDAIERLAFTCLSLTLAWLFAAAVTAVPAWRRSASLQIGAVSLALLALALLLPGGRAEPRGAPGAGVAPSPAGIRTPLPQPAGHLLLLNFDGADLDTILTLQAQGKLPGFMRLREEGAFGRLQSIVPCEAAVTRTTLATGRRPYRHGVRSGLARRMFGRGPALEVVPVGIGFDLLLGPAMAIRPTSVSDRSGRSLWEIASDAGGTGEAVGFDVDLDRDGDRVTVTAGSGSASALAPILDPETIRRAEPALQGQLGELRAALRADRWVESSLDRLAGDARSGVAALSFPGLDRVAHVFLRYARPQEFGNVTGREVDLYGEVLERYYRWVDAIVGRAIDAAGARGWVMVTSSHGIEPAALRRRLLEMATGGEAPSGDHDAGPDGVLFMHGPGIARGPLKGKGTIADVVPTALYALKLPVARDLDGAILTGLFTARYILEHPVTVIGSYETP